MWRGNMHTENNDMQKKKFVAHKIHKIIDLKKKIKIQAKKKKKVSVDEENLLDIIENGLFDRTDETL